MAFSAGVSGLFCLSACTDSGYFGLFGAGARLCPGRVCSRARWHPLSPSRSECSAHFQDKAPHSRGFFLQIIMKKEVSETKWSLVHLARAALGCGNSALGAVTPGHVFACAPSSALRWVISDFHRISVSMNYCFKTLFFSQVGICQDFLIHAFFWHFLAVIIT